MKSFFPYFLILLLHFSLNVFPSLSAFELTVLHVNDIHVRIDETDAFSERCQTGSKDCYGGLARLKYQVNALQDENKIFLNAGDFYQGNEWYTTYKWKVVAFFSNLLGFAAMALGNHEFDDSVSGLIPFLANASFPIVASNVNIEKEPQLKGLFSPSTILNVSGVSVGIIGYVTTDTSFISSPGSNVSFTDEIASLTAEAKRLKDSGIEIIIALGHSGIEKDTEIARKVPFLDLVVGGHSHSFLYSNTHGVPLPSNEVPVNEYPIVVESSSGRKVLVVQAYAFTKYLGRLHVSFNDKFEVESWSGAPILLDSSIPQDEALLHEIEKWKEELDGFDEQDDHVLGVSKIDLSVSRSSETLFGDILSDALVYHYKHRFVTLGILNAGIVRSSISIGNITKKILKAVYPYGNTVDLVSIKGQHIKEIFEVSFSRFSEDGTNWFGGFLQVSGFQITADVTLPVGQRILSCQVSTFDNDWVDIDNEMTYSIVMPSFLVSGGDGQSNLSQNTLSVEEGPLNIDVLGSYIKHISPIMPQKPSNRITIYTSWNRPGRINYKTESRPKISSGSHKNELPLSLVSLFSYFNMRK